MADETDLSPTIARAKQELEHMIDLNPQIMLLLDRRGTVTRVNRALMDLLHTQDFQQVLGRRMEDLFPTGVPEFFGSLLNSGEEDLREATVKQSGCAPRLLRFTRVDSGRRDELMVIIVNDITREKERERAEEQALKKDAVTMLVGALAHNINQPLTVINAKAHLIHFSLERGGMEKEEISRSLKDIMKRSMQISELLEWLRQPKAFITEPYLPDVDMLDLEKSVGVPKDGRASAAVVLKEILTTLETRQPGSIGHSTRTGDLSLRLAEAMGLDEPMRGIIRFCGTFHDVGNIGIPDVILQKSGRLTQEEAQVLKRHVDVGANLLGCFPLLQEEADVLLAHHERFDGTGYPRGLKGDAIPLASRVLAVADAFDRLMTGDKSRECSSTEWAAKEIEACSGTQFDPEVVSAFSQCQNALPGT
jgi:HD-GYP domain-containing protein (c-di-GMP phosphodiesterase class II)